MGGERGLLDAQAIPLDEITHPIDGVSARCGGEGEPSPWLHDDQPHCHLDNGTAGQGRG